MASFTIDEPQEDFPESAHPPAQPARRSLKEALACPPIGLTPLQDFDLANFISAPWYAQAMQPTFYQPATTLFCFQTLYKPTDKMDLTVDVPDPIPLDPARDLPLSALGSTWIVAAGPSQPGASDFKGK
ncbi:hypothetical protein CVIRNUC_008847 [Coccomyxa viridis]|uniref:Uncharacterized protein n=1 Tax=Coccomyxa viridis TaxID=1274662 RepID=A0AAV1IFQ1_9CHLO|nr:hypothetical protein CVIRNUC_008847 [Coccomyxa viridis]